MNHKNCYSKKFFNVNWLILLCEVFVWYGFKIWHKMYDTLKILSTVLPGCGLYALSRRVYEIQIPHLIQILYKAYILYHTLILTANSYLQIMYWIIIWSI